MRKLFVLFAAAIGGTFVVAAPALAHPVDTDGHATPTRSPVVLVASDPPKAVAKVAKVRTPAPLPRYTVVTGDSLSSIGARVHRTWEQLASYNHIPNPNLILTHQVLVIPAASYVAGPVSLPAPAPSYTPPARPQSHYVAPSRTYSSTRSSGGSGYSGGSGSGSFTGIWACIAAHESGGNPATNTGNGYYGGLQFTQGTWNANGGTGNPANASAAEQQRVAQNVVNASGGSYGAWPNTSRMCGV